MRVCVVGSGGREHALATVLARDADVVVTPGNPGMATVAVTAEPPDQLQADLFVIGPEQPLVDGLADRLRAQGKLVFGPGAAGAMLEGSKAWMKQLLDEAGVPTAAHASFGAADAQRAEAHLRACRPPYVIKTDGLAAGKGVLVTSDLEEAIGDLRDKLSGRAFADAGRRVVIEEAMAGPEISVLAVCDGKTAVPLVAAQDHKRVGDGDRGPNTGGMGAYAPVPAAGDELVGRIMERAVEPTLHALRGRGIDYRGVLYAGLMLTGEGPRVLEFNVRFGDPETQVVLPLLTSSLTELLAGAAAGRLSAVPEFGAGAAVCVVAASAGYPSRAEGQGKGIAGLDDREQIAGDAAPGVTVFHAGVARDPAGRLVTAGGRVLSVTGLGGDLCEARERAYAGVAQIRFEGMQYRRDIAATVTGVHS
jgi:phosphoribosylamine--glycine ligase